MHTTHGMAQLILIWPQTIEKYLFLPIPKKQVKKPLWAPSNYHGSVGQGFEVVENYIRGQEGHHGGIISILLAVS